MLNPITFRALGLLISGLLLTGAAHAAAPLQKTQAPGYYRMMLGEFEVTVLFDGNFDLKPKDLLKGPSPAHLADLLAASFEGDTVPTSVDAFLVNTGTKLVLIDTGCAAFCGPGFGGVIANLKAAGYQPDQVDEIYITHMHLDHIGGLVVDGQRAFPNALVRADQADADYWLSQANEDQAPADKKEAFAHAMTALTPYVEAGKFKSFKGNSDLIPGIKAIATPGHTPGHTVYSVESSGKKLLLWGDIIHVASVQFPEPSAMMMFDTDTKQAEAQRKWVFADAAKNGYLVSAAHLSFPGIGHLRVDGKGYRFVPIDYSVPNP